MPLLASLLAPLTRRGIYQPASTRLPPSATDAELSVRGATVRGWVVNPGQSQALIYLGGNAESLEHRRAALAEQLPGHTTYLFAYRGYGASDGRPSQSRLVTDALALQDHVAARHPGAEVDVLGRSLGSGVAVQLAARRDVRRLVLVTPFDSASAVAADHVPRLPRNALADPWDSRAVLDQVSAPVLVLRAGQDTVILPARTDALLAGLPRETQVVDFPRADHASIILEDGYWPAIAAFLAD